MINNNISAWTFDQDKVTYDDKEKKKCDWRGGGCVVEGIYVIAYGGFVILCKGGGFFLCRIILSFIPVLNAFTASFER